MAKKTKLTKMKPVTADSQSKKFSPGSRFGDKETPPFRVHTVRNAYRHIAARRAVITPVLGPDMLKYPQASLDKLRVMWHCKVEALRKAGWKPLLTQKNISYMRNCPPFGVATDTTSKTCNHPMICPFCFARLRVIYPYCKLEAILYGKAGLPGQAPLVRPDLWIVAFKCLTSGTGKKLEGKQATLRDHWFMVHNTMKNTRTLERDKFEALYASVLFECYPFQNGLTLTRSGVMLIDKYPSYDVATDYTSNPKRTFRIYEPTRKNLMEAVSYAFSYPKPLLLTDHEQATNPVSVARFLELIHRARMSTWYGSNTKKI